MARPPEWASTLSAISRSRSALEAKRGLDLLDFQIKVEGDVVDVLTNVDEAVDGGRGDAVGFDTWRTRLDNGLTP